MKQSDRAMRKADAEMHNECRRQVMLVYGAAAVALKNKWRFGQQKILDVFDSTDDVWHECGNDNKVSMLQLLEDETGIEIKLTNSSASWHDLDFLNGDIGRYEQITKAQYIFMRKRQTKWLGAIIQACLYLALYRDYGFGVVKLRNLMNEIDRIRAEVNDKENRIISCCRSVTGINVVDRFNNKKYA